jgi:hypothetical protein
MREPLPGRGEVCWLEFQQTFGRQMNAKSNLLIREGGGVALFFGAVFLLLFAANLRSRLYYDGPNYGFLLWISCYWVVTGIGLLKFRKWAVLLAFLPGVFYGAIVVDGLVKGASGQTPWIQFAAAAVFNYLFAIALLAIPANMLRSWSELRW